MTPDLPCAPPNTPQLRSVHSTPLYTCVLYTTVHNVQRCTRRSSGQEWRLSSGLCPVFPPITGCLVADWPAAATGCTDTRWPPATSRHRHVANTQQLTPRRPPLSHDMSPMCSLALPNSLLSVSPRYLVRPWAGPRLPGRPESSSPSLVTRHSHCPLSSWRSDTSLHWWPLSAPDCRLGRPG